MRVGGGNIEHEVGKGGCSYRMKEEVIRERLLYTKSISLPLRHPCGEDHDARPHGNVQLAQHAEANCNVEGPKLRRGSSFSTLQPVGDGGGTQFVKA